jgi:hypothetical protein
MLFIPKGATSEPALMPPTMLACEPKDASCEGECVSLGA